MQEYEDAQDNYDSAQANLAAAKANLITAELKLSYTKVYASVNGEVTNLDISEGAYASAGQQVMALVDSDSYWVAGYFKETQLRNISTGDAATISLMGNEDLPIRGTVRSVGWGIFVTDGFLRRRHLAALSRRHGLAALSKSNHRLGSATTEVPRTHSGRQFGDREAANRLDRLGSNFTRRTERKYKSYSVIDWHIWKRQQNTTNFAIRKYPSRLEPMQFPRSVLAR